MPKLTKRDKELKENMDEYLEKALLVLGEFT